jgi:predicted nucleic acid-binding protein
MTPVFIDTPVWRDYFAGRSPELDDRVDELITQRLARVSGAVIQEVLSMARTLAECDRLAEALLGGYDRAEADEQDIALMAGRIACRLRAEGHAPLPPLRVLSAAAALTAHSPLLTTDATLHTIARHFPLKILCA